MSSIKSIYIAGPMRGIPGFNFPAFDAAVEELKTKLPDVQVISPADIDRKYGFDPVQHCTSDHDWNVIPDCLDMKEIMVRDLHAVMECDAIFMLPGWSKSKGASTERLLADTLGKTILYQDGAENPGDGAPDNPDGEHIVENAKTGGRKGQKLARFDLIPPYPLWKLAELYGAGAKKYAAHNWLRGYDWSLSFAAAMRHLWEFWGGEELDPETGMPHATCAAFHCFALTQFMETFRDGDDRPKTPCEESESGSAAHEGYGKWRRYGNVKVFSHKNVNSDDYVDVEIFAEFNVVPPPDSGVPSWKLVVSKDKDTGKVFRSEPQYSPDNSTRFESVPWRHVPSAIEGALTIRANQIMGELKDGR